VEGDRRKEELRDDNRYAAIGEMNFPISINKSSVRQANNLSNINEFLIRYYSFNIEI